MDQANIKKLKFKIYFLFPLTFLILAVMFFWPAGTLQYWPGWAVIIELMVPMFFVALYFLKRSPEFLERRLLMKEKEPEQKAITKLATFLFSVGFLVPGFDFRFGWSHVPLWLIILANVIVLLSYYLVFLSFKENEFGGRTVEIFSGQRVIDTGPYAIIRHPMYAGMIPLYLAIPLALGSYWAILFMVPVCISMIYRLLNEEKILSRELPGYKEYCEKVHYHLIPYIW